MSSISDRIERYLLHIVEESHGEINLKRNDLSEMFSCVPSQINYVIKTRFTIERGYLVESKRGEGGYLRIIKLPAAEAKVYLDRIREGSGDYLSGDTARNFLNRLVEEEIISPRERDLLWQLFKDESLPCGKEEKSVQRAKMIRNLIAYLVKEEDK